MDQEKIAEAFNLLNQDSNNHALIPLYHATCFLGICRVYTNDLDSLVEMTRNHLWHCPFDTSPTYFLNLNGFNLLHRFAIEYEKLVEENSACLEQKLTELIEDFSKKRA